MAAPREKRADAVAFISNCGAQSFRLEAVQQLGTAVQVHSYGACERNSDADGASKEDILPSYRFTLAFENSQVGSAASLMTGFLRTCAPLPGHGCMGSERGRWH